jgi:hypothetical protein
MKFNTQKWIGAGGIMALLPILMSAVGCAYGHKRYPVRPAATTIPELAVVQFDDYGKAWVPEDVQQALDLVSAASMSNNSVVLLYVHGWHHNAKEGDANLEAFQNTLRDLQKTLALPMYVESRRELTGSPEVRVVGIYAGWRGRSLPGFLDYLTFWGRKAAAERVGEGDFREFCERLQKIYEDRNSPRNNQRFMGLALVGHSFGGQVLFKATVEKLEKAMMDLTPQFSGITNSSPTAAQSEVNGLGDIVVLINPAFEADQFARVASLNSRLAYSSSQTPAILVVSGEGDTARQIAFPIGRRFTRPFRPGFRGDQKPLWNKALGEYEKQRTHTLTRTTNSNTLSAESYADPQKLIGVDFTDHICMGGGLLEPISKEREPFTPLVVAYTSSKLIIGHSGIFTEEFREFLTDYVAFVEGKRILLNAARNNAKKGH